MLKVINKIQKNTTQCVFYLDAITLVFPQVSISNYIEQIIFLCLQVRLSGSSISTITSNKLEHNTVTSTKAITFWRLGHEHSCFDIINVLFKVQIFNKETAKKKPTPNIFLLTSKSLTHWVEDVNWSSEFIG